MTRGRTSRSCFQERLAWMGRNIEQNMLVSTIPSANAFLLVFSSSTKHVNYSLSILCPHSCKLLADHLKSSLLCACLRPDVMCMSNQTSRIKANLIGWGTGCGVLWVKGKYYITSCWLMDQSELWEWMEMHTTTFCIRVEKMTSRNIGILLSQIWKEIRNRCGTRNDDASQV